MKETRAYWIKERFNPQLGTYYVPMGQLSKTEAKRHDRPIYGSNLMHAYKTKELYEAKLEELKLKGENVQ